jgi:hypothetical protein
MAMGMAVSLARCGLVMVMLRGGTGHCGYRGLIVGWR